MVGRPKKVIDPNAPVSDKPKRVIRKLTLDEKKANAAKAQERANKLLMGAARLEVIEMFGKLTAYGSDGGKAFTMKDLFYTVSNRFDDVPHETVLLLLGEYLGIKGYKLVKVEKQTRGPRKAAVQ